MVSSSDGDDNEDESDKDAGSSSLKMDSRETSGKEINTDVHVGRPFSLRNSEESSSARVVSPAGIRERSLNKRVKRSMPSWLCDAFQTSHTSTSDDALRSTRVSTVGVVPPSPIDLVESDVETGHLIPSVALKEAMDTYKGDEGEASRATNKVGLTGSNPEGTLYPEDSEPGEYEVVETWDSDDDDDFAPRQEIYLPKLIRDDQPLRSGKGRLPISGSNSFVSDERVVRILPLDGSLRISHSSNVTKTVSAVLDVKGSLTSAIANLPGKSPTDRTNAVQSDWITVTGVKLDVSLFWLDGECPVLDSREEVKRRFEVIRVHAQSVVGTISPHYVDATWGNMSPRDTVPMEKFLLGHEKGKFFHRNMRCAAFKLCGMVLVFRLFPAFNMEV